MLFDSQQGTIALRDNGRFFSSEHNREITLNGLFSFAGAERRTLRLGEGRLAFRLSSDHMEYAPQVLEIKPEAGELREADTKLRILAIHAWRIKPGFVESVVTLNLDNDGSQGGILLEFAA